MESPECPVCLQPYDATATVPRVLPCGHSACESCLNQLPNPHPRTIRCPSCTQLLNFPHPLGAASLPKNIDLLRLNYDDHHNTSSVKKQADRVPGRGLVGPIWSQEVYSEWKDWVLSRVSVELVDGLEGRLRAGNFASVSPLRCRLKEGKKVRLVKLGDCGLDDGVFEYSYLGTVMEVLSGMKESLRTELRLVFDVSLSCQNVCEVYGLWFDAESRSLYMVSERRDSSLLEVVDGENEEECVKEMMGNDQVSYSVMIGLEVCEVLMRLRSQGFCFGCLGLSCFVLDEFGHVLVDIVEVVLSGRKFIKWVTGDVNQRRNTCFKGPKELLADLFELHVFVSPELLFDLLADPRVQVGGVGLKTWVDYSDVWLLACILISLLSTKQLTGEMFNYLDVFLHAASDEAVSKAKVVYVACIDKLGSDLKASLGSKFASLQHILCKCLHVDPGSRPSLAAAWESLRSLISKPSDNMVVSFHGDIGEVNLYCLVLGELCRFSIESSSLTINELEDGCDDGREVRNNVLEEQIERDITKGITAGRVKCGEMEGHLDTVTGFCVGGGYLFSSSFDKTIIVWSLQDFVRLHTFRGHENRVMALAFVDGEQPMCISGDNGGGICVWAVSLPLKEEPLRKWSEPKDWRYSGIHALAVSGTGLLFTGSGDWLIKAWSLLDSSLAYTMEGHKSVVCSLWIHDGVLYSGSWDGTVRLWSLHDHSHLATFGPDAPGTLSSVLSVYADQEIVIATYENGFIKLWSNDVVKQSIQVHSGAIFALSKDEKWLFTGGWDKNIKVQEIHLDDFDMEARLVGSIATNSVITALLYTQGLLFVGFANKSIKVYHNRP